MGVDLNMWSEDDEWCMVMYCVVVGGGALSIDVIKTLLLFGADRNARDMYGCVFVDCFFGMMSEVNFNGLDVGGLSLGGSVSMGGNG